MAPPTIATQIIAEPSAARGPKPSQAKAKMVGNMMEMNRPIASNAQPDTAPVAVADIKRSARTTAAADASTVLCIG